MSPVIPSGGAVRLRALLGLVGTCALWGLSFPLMKALGLHLAAAAPGVSTWFVAATTVVLRFGSSALLVCAFGWAKPSSAELKQAALLGAFSGGGMLLQMDALNFTPASTSAFLTQGYIVILPLVAALSARSWPHRKTVLCVLASSTGLAVLSGFDWARLRLGRGETETLMAACCFAVQILSLDAPAFRSNRPKVVTPLMFMFVAVLLLPIAIGTSRAPRDLAVFFADPTALGLLLVLTVPCTAIAFSLMNRYQPDVSASEAGIIYGAEPLFTSLLALFLPEILAGLTNIEYLNEELTPRLLIGGGLIVSANVLLQLP